MVRYFYGLFRFCIIASGLLLTLASCDEKLCMPPEATRSDSTPLDAVSPLEQKPSHVVVIIDQSWGMSGFVRQPTQNKLDWRDSEFTKVVGALGLLDPTLKPAYYVLPPDKTATGVLNPAPRAIERLSDAVASKNCDPDKCPGYDQNAYISSFVKRAIERSLGIGNASLAENSDDLILLVTDLQPDIPAEAAGNKVTYLQDTFNKIVANHLAIGILPVVSSFYGKVYDTQTLARETKKPETPTLTSAQDRQPFFLIPMGRDPYVRWMLTRLKVLRDARTHEKYPLEPVVFSDRIPPMPANLFGFRIDRPGGLTPQAALPAIDDEFQRLTPQLLVLHRKNDSTEDSAFEYRAAAMSEKSDLTRYEVQITDERPQTPKVWVHVDGTAYDTSCASQWSPAPDLSIFQTSFHHIPPSPADDGGDELEITIKGTQKQTLPVNAMFYVEQTVTVAPAPVVVTAPNWVKEWNVDANTIWRDRLDGREKRLSQVSIGVNALGQMFDRMQTQPTAAPKRVMLQFAMKVEAN